MVDLPKANSLGLAERVYTQTTDVGNLRLKCSLDDL